MSRINYLVPGSIGILKQPSRNTCWAAVGAMMVNWHQRTGRSVADVMYALGTRWSGMLSRNQGLAPADTEPYARACGSRTEPLLCHPVSGWLTLLRRHGILAVVTANASSFHARILRGIAEPPGRETRTFVRLIDPAGGRQYGLEFSRFIQQFEAGIRSPRAQIWHY